MCQHPDSRRAHLKLSAERGTTSAKSCEHTVVRVRLSRCTAQLCLRACVRVGRPRWWCERSLAGVIAGWRDRSAYLHLDAASAVSSY